MVNKDKVHGDKNAVKIHLIKFTKNTVMRKV